ncbi:MAG: ATP-dependent DNA helicase RecG [Verrucomicrobiales bacterium]|nr:ATP-dependent DNA helicase RecG [Verrucomicrobiales bacterium]
MEETSEDLRLDTALQELPSLGLDQRALSALESRGITTVEDLLTHYPRRYEDRTRFDGFPNQPSSDPVCLRGTVTDTATRFAGRKRFFEMRVEDLDSAMNAVIVCRWFNMPFMAKVFAADQVVVLYGKPKMSGRRLVMDHPEYEIIDEDIEGDLASPHVERITPIYQLSSGISQLTLRAAVYHLLELLYDEVLPDLLPEGVVAGWCRAKAVRQAHFPEDMDQLQQARRYLALQEFTSLQLQVLKQRSDYASQGGKVHCGPGVLLDKFLEHLPFEATAAQQRSIAEIRQDLASTHPMNRLLQGDVGSGKTLVAIAAMLLVIEDGYQAALMVPTQILAEQHFLVLQKWLQPLGVRVGLRTAARKEDGFLPLMSGSEEAQILVGTHALISNQSELSNLGLAVIDEQHKFGVAQRAKLIDQGDMPDVLVMTATPIPRTLTLTAYGDLDVSLVDEMPAGRGAIITGVRDLKKTKQAADFVRQHLQQGRQAYIVYPLIEESENLTSLAATVEFEKWQKRFKGFVCALLHGRMSGEEKERVMNDFRAGKVHVLVSTTVIEVGVDVPNANMMLVFNAERFGLAQLHQLRGRIGRGEHKSYCILMVDKKKAVDSADKLKVLEESRDGFRIAEEDLKLRGPGEVLGTAQSGMPDLKMADLVLDVDLVHEARVLAEKILIEDPLLKKPQNRQLLNLLDRKKVEESAGHLS